MIGISPSPVIAVVTSERIGVALVVGLMFEHPLVLVDPLSSSGIDQAISGGQLDERLGDTGLAENRRIHHA
jgi:hypothetical protein